MVEMEDVGKQALFPRSADRGLIEAINCPCCWACCCIFPIGSADRGLIEASWWRWKTLGNKRYFPDQLIGASLKPLIAPAAGPVAAYFRSDQLIGASLKPHGGDGRRWETSAISPIS